MNQTFTLGSEKCYEYEVPCHYLGIDFKVVYDANSRNELGLNLDEYGFHEKLTPLIKSMMHEIQYCVRIFGELSGSFKFHRRHRQDNGLSYLLCSVTIDRDDLKVVDKKVYIGGKQYQPWNQEANYQHKSCLLWTAYATAVTQTYPPHNMYPV